jgi:uncharacterized protein YecT (DUF1311 family)
MKRVATLLLALLCGVCLTSGQTAKPAQQVIPAEWYPALHPSLETLLDQLKQANSQSDMNMLSRKVADVRDAQLFIAYVRLYDRLSPKERTALVQEQTAWLKKRTAAAKAAVSSGKGSLAPLEANDAEATFTEQRLTELRERLKKLTKKSGD